MTTFHVGKLYSEADAHRRTKVTRDGVTINLRENFWRDTDTYQISPDEWAVTANLQITEECGSRQEVLTHARHINTAVEVLGALDYELHSVEEPGVTLWTKPEDRNNE